MIWLRRAMALLVLAGLVVLLTFIVRPNAAQLDLTEPQQAVIDAWLQCEDCTDHELDSLLSTADQAGIVGREDVIEALRRTLTDPYPDSTLERNLRDEWAALDTAGVTADEFVSVFAENYRATAQARAALALGALADTAWIADFHGSSGFTAARPDVRAAVEQSLLEAGAPGFQPPPPDRVVVQPTPLRLLVGGAGVLQALVLDADGNVIYRPITWGSADPSVATVTSPEHARGDVTAQGAVGSATDITASVTSGSATVSGSARVEIIDPPPLPDTVIVIVDGNAQRDTVRTRLDRPMVVRVTDRAGNPRPNVDVSWEVDQGTATLDGDSSVTDRDGYADMSLVFGAAAGRVWVIARAGAYSVVFRLYAGS